MPIVKHGCVVLLAMLASACTGSNSTTPSPSPTPTPTPTATTFSLSGIVTDTTTSAGISGATVTIADGSNAGKSTTTDGSGNYSFTGLQQSGFTVTISASNYVSQSKGVTLTSNQTLSFSLTRVLTTPSTFTVNGTVTDGTSGGVLPNINVQVTDSAGNSKSTLSGSAGTYSITGLAAGAVTVTASAISYQTTRLTVTISSDTRFDIVLQRTVCTFTLSRTSLSFRSSGGTGTVTVGSQATGCAWAARSNDAFMIITSGSAGNDNGTVMFAVAANIGAARLGTLTIAGQTVTVTQDAATLAILKAVYDPTLKAPVCGDVGSGCDSGALLNGSGGTEPNQPNTIANACSDGGGQSAIIDSIQISTVDGTPLAAGSNVLITASIRLTVPVGWIRPYIALDALHPAWIGKGNFDVTPAQTGTGRALALFTWPAGGAALQAIRVSFSAGSTGQFGPGPCATGPDDDNDDLVFRVQ